MATSGRQRGGPERDAERGDAERGDAERGGGDGLLAACIDLALRRAWTVALIVFALAAVGAVLAARLPLVTDVAALLPADARSVVDQRRSEAYLGNTSLLVAVVEAKGEDAPRRAREAAAALAARLAADPEMTEVVFRLDLSFFEDNALLYLPTAELESLRDDIVARSDAEVMRRNPLFFDLSELSEDEADDADAGADAESNAESNADALRELADELRPERYRDRLSEATDHRIREYLRDDAGTTYLVLAQPRRHAADIGYNRRVIARLDAHVAALDPDLLGPGLSIRYAGNYWSTTEENTATRRDLRRAALISLATLVLVILAYFRRARALWLVFAPLLAGVAIMMGYVQLAVGRLNTITGFTLALFMGLSIDFSIHLLARFDEERRRGADTRAALLCTYRETGRAAVAAALTSAAGFLALLAADFQGFREFGIIASGGIAICLAAICALTPALIALGDRARRPRSSSPSVSGSRTHHALSDSRTPVEMSEIRTPTRAPTWAASLGLVALVALAALAASAPGLRWEHDFRALRGGSAQTVATAERVFDILGYSPQPALRIADSAADARALSAACNAERDARGANSAVLRCVSLPDFVPAEQPAKLALIADIAAALSDSRLAFVDDAELRATLRRARDRLPRRAIAPGDLPASIRRSFASADGHKFFVKAYPSVMTWDMTNNARFTDELRAGDDVVATDLGPMGAPVIMADVLRTMKRDGAVVAVLAVVAVFAVLWLGRRSLAYAAACQLSLVVGLACAAGAMALLGLRLGFYNMVAVPLLIGVGVDNNIHLLRRYHAAGRGSWPRVLRTTGRACAMAALTTMAGFAGLAVASHLGLRTIGALALLGIAACTAVSLIALPLALGWLERRVRGTLGGLLPPQTPERQPERQPEAPAAEGQ